MSYAHTTAFTEQAPEANSHGLLPSQGM